MQKKTNVSNIEITTATTVHYSQVNMINISLGLQIKGTGICEYMNIKIAVPVVRFGQLPLFPLALVT